MYMDTFFLLLFYLTKKNIYFWTKEILYAYISFSNGIFRADELMRKYDAMQQQQNLIYILH